MRARKGNALRYSERRKGSTATHRFTERMSTGEAAK